MQMTETELQKDAEDLMMVCERIRSRQHPMERGDAEELTVLTAEVLDIPQPVPWWLYATAHTVIETVRHGHKQ
jgi:hypothetical protein